MYIFVWVATEYNSARAKSFSCIEDAWEYFQNLAYIQFPPHILCFHPETVPVQIYQISWQTFVKEMEEYQNRHE